MMEISYVKGTARFLTSKKVDFPFTSKMTGNANLTNEEAHSDIWHAGHFSQSYTIQSTVVTQCC